MIRWLAALGACILAVSIASTAGGQSKAPVPRECSGSAFSPTRDSTNPLELSKAPGADPLTGAQFFVDGPAHGSAASAIATILGFNPKSFSDSESWDDFDRTYVQRGLKDHPQDANQVHELEKIAREPEVQRFSLFTGGGARGAITGQANKIFCDNLQADPNAIPIFQTLFALPHGQYCASRGSLAANGGTFRREVNEMAAGTGRRPVMFLLELDGVATSHCLSHSALKVWEGQLRYEIRTLGALPHAVVYMEGGYSDANSPRYTAKVLNAIGVRRIRGFYTNDTHLNWTIDEVHWADKVSRMTHGAHFIVNTAQNGNGPLRPKNRAKHGNEILCNPPGRGLGPEPTTQTGYANVDGWMWTAVPGNSSGHCHGGPASGTFWPARGVQLATNANDRLGPSFPSQPY